MNKPLIAAVGLSVLMLSGCGWFHPHSVYEGAKQRKPLEIPSGLDRPNVSDALTIPNVNAKPVGTRSQVLQASADVAAAYAQAGKLIVSSRVGAIASHDDKTHIYTVNVGEPPAAADKPGFFGRMFGHHDNDEATPDLDSPASAGAVTVKVAAAGGGSTITVSGKSENVAQVVDALKKGGFGH